MVRLVCVVLGLFFASPLWADEPTTGSGPSTPPNERPESTPPLGDAPVSAKILRYAQRVIAKHDRNRDGSLTAEEWKSMHGRPASIDADQDGQITLKEYSQHIAEYGRWRQIRLFTPGPETEGQPSPDSGQPQEGTTASPTDDKALRRNRKFYVADSRLPKGLPRTFLVRDLNGDGQLTLAEFAPKGLSADLERFKKLDANLDNVVTAREFMRGPRPAAQTDEQSEQPPSP